MVFRLTHPVVVCLFFFGIISPSSKIRDQALRLGSFERDLRLSLKDVFESVDLKDLARRTPISTVNTVCLLFSNYSTCELTSPERH